MSPFEKYVPDGNEKADELAKEGAMKDEGFVARTRAKTAQQESEAVCAALQNAVSFHCFGGGEELKPQATRKVDFRGLEKRRNKAQNGVVFRQVTSIDV